MNWKKSERERHCTIPNFASNKNIIKLNLSLLNLESFMPWRHMVEWRYSSASFDLGTRWRWLVNYMPLTIYPSGKKTRYPLYKRLGCSRSRSRRCGEEKNLVLPGNRTRVVQPVARRYTDWAVPTPILPGRLRNIKKKSQIVGFPTKIGILTFRIW
jgi:hypothetical protein